VNLFHLSRDVCIANNALNRCANATRWIGVNIKRDPRIYRGFRVSIWLVGPSPIEYFLDWLT